MAVGNIAWMVRLRRQGYELAAGHSRRRFFQAKANLLSRPITAHFLSNCHEENRMMQVYGTYA
jgi:hypothetical protein